MVNFSDLAQGNTDITLSVKCSDLMNFGKYLIEAAKEEAKSIIRNGEDDPLLSVSETMRRLKVSNRTTLWRWEQREYLIPVRSGGKLLYRNSDIQRIINQKSIGNAKQPSTHAVFCGGIN